MRPHLILNPLPAFFPLRAQDYKENCLKTSNLGLARSEKASGITWKQHVNTQINIVYICIVNTVYKSHNLWHCERWGTLCSSKKRGRPSISRKIQEANLIWSFSSIAVASGCSATLLLAQKLGPCHLSSLFSSSSALRPKTCPDMP